MIAKKPWTVMVYLAADNNLTNFGIDSLRQMKAAARDTINVVAEFDTGPMNPNNRYLFGEGTRFGSLEQNLLSTFGPTNAGDPKNLENFIVSTAVNYPADHYFVIIWGHGAGVDDHFPQAPDASFTPRHNLLGLFKGMLDAPNKGMLDAPNKGMLDAPNKSMLAALATGMFGSPNNGVFKAVKDGFDTFRKGVLGALQEGLSRILQPNVLGVVSKPAANGYRPAPLNETPLAQVRKQVMDDLENEILSLWNGAFGSFWRLRPRLLDALQRGILDAMDSGIVYELLQEVVDVLQGGGTCAKGQFEDLLRKGLLLALDAGIVEVLRTGVLASGPSGDSGTKGLAFVDHPTGFLTNADLRRALASASRQIGQKIEIFGMDACNMNMIEIGYDLRESANFMVASQDDIPDASWPYDRIMAQLSSTPNILPRDLAALVANTYVAGYSDYIGEPVSLSVLNLDYSGSIEPLVTNLATELKKAFGDVLGRRAIANARNNVRNFGQNQFIDLRHFCQLLTGAPSALAKAAGALNGAFEGFVAENEISIDETRRNVERDCNGTSIFFPQDDPIADSHQETIRDYSRLEFARITGWADFLKLYLGRKRVEARIAQAAIEAMSRRESDQPPGKLLQPPDGKDKSKPAN